jgi:hypothetical protein
VFQKTGRLLSESPRTTPESVAEVGWVGLGLEIAMEEIEYHAHRVLIRFNKLTFLFLKNNLKSVLLSYFTMNFMTCFMKGQKSKNLLLELTTALLK